MPKIRTQAVFNPLYTNRDKSIVLITGGRGSGKSFNASTFVQRSSFKRGRLFLYCRYTMSSASISVIPEFLEKVELDGHSRYFRPRSADVENLSTGSKVLFRGIRTSSGNQTAKLKSIHGITDFVCDEAEEWQSEREFDVLKLSLRKKGITNRVFIIMNPTDEHHFIYRRYIKDTHKIEYFDGVPVQISTHPDVLHIHTTYLDNLEHLGEEFIREVEDIKLFNPSKYAHTIIGRWSDISEGAIFSSISLVDEIPDFAKRKALAIDFGYTNDPTAIVECAIHEDTLYIDELCYNTGMLTSDILKILEVHKGKKIISESADPRLVQEIANDGHFILPVEKGAGSIEAGISKTKEFKICVTKRSLNAREEFRSYSWAQDKDGKYINQPATGQADHIMDAVRYYVLGELLGKILKPKTVELPSWLR